MGLLERALEYKRKINEEGKETLIDRIAGPAETAIIPPNAEKIQAIEIDEDIVAKEDTAIEEDIATEDTIVSEEDIIPEEDIVDLDIDEPIEIPKAETPKAEIPKVEVHDTESDIKNSESEEDDESEFTYHNMLYEVQKEFISADTLEEIYSILIFSIMGQLGVSSASIIIPAPGNESEWIITDSYGIKIADTNTSWRIDEGILKILSDNKSIIDLEDIKDDVSLRDDYYKFTSADARIITPLVRNDILTGAILTGEKISFGEFTETEKEFLQELSEISSMKIESLAKQELVKSELLKLKAERDTLAEIESFQNALLSAASVDEIEKIIHKNFYMLGIDSYSIFMKDNTDGDYYPIYYDPHDTMEFNNSGFKIKRDNRLVNFLINKNASIMIDDFIKSVVVMDTFGKNRVVNMELFITCPFIISGNLLGFVTIFKIDPDVEISDIDIRIQKINRFLFSYLENIYEADRSLNKYNDLTAGLYNKIKGDIQHAHSLNIPVSLLLITVKNYKGFYEKFGVPELEKLFSYIAEIIGSKLSAGDFMAKIDRNRFIVVLPGKDKRYSVMLANLVKNDVVNKYSTNDFKLLITSLISVYPDDGTDLFSILEVLE